MKFFCFVKKYEGGFFNIWEEAQIQKELAVYLKELAPGVDIFCFQEAYPDMRFLEEEILADHQKVTDYKYLDRDDYFRQAIYIRREIPLISSRTLFQDSPDCGLTRYMRKSRRESRDCILATCTGYLSRAISSTRRAGSGSPKPS